MFFLMGVCPHEKRLSITSPAACPCCGRWGRAEVFVTAMEFSLFFLPVFRWGKKYIARTLCCGQVCKLPKKLEESAARGEQIELSGVDWFASSQKHCRFCGFTTGEAFEFCSKCGRRF